jgi:alkanesulfonate monooxygenase SsuD/methylene tetrahydromethanopterin reductase-like flavin-dependent oxidoreductase (luciferase family)
MMSNRQLSLNFFIYPDGHHEAAWRHKASTTNRILDVTYYQELAQRAEAHKFDAVFFADGPVLSDNVRYAQRFRLEPITLLTAIASATRRIGLIATASTTYTEPYNLARLFASLDHISGGRAGWNIVTTSSPQAAQNFGLPEHPPHHERYERARGNISMSSPPCGTVGRTTRWSMIPSPAFSPTPARSTRSTTPENTSACAVR